MRHFTNLVASGAILAASTVALAAETLNLAHFVPPQHVVTRSTIEPLQAGVAEAAPDLTIQVYPGGELGSGPLEQYVRVVQGTADIAWGLPGYTSTQFARTMIAELPGAIPEGMTGYDALWNAYEAGLLQDEFPRTVPLALYLSEPNIFIMKDHEVRTPEDVAGLKLRVSGSAAASVVKALGAVPVQMPAGEIYNALQTGLVDGVVTGASAVGDFKLDEVANSYTYGPNLGHITFYLVMNEARYEGLSEAHRAAIDGIAGRRLSQFAEAGWLESANAVTEQIKAAGDNTVIELSEEEAAAFNALTEPVTQQIVGDLGAEDVLSAMRGE